MKKIAAARIATVADISANSMSSNQDSPRRPFIEGATTSKNPSKIL
jgi:hypothetical protein